MKMNVCLDLNKLKTRAKSLNIYQFCQRGIRRMTDNTITKGKKTKRQNVVHAHVTMRQHLKKVGPSDRSEFNEIGRDMNVNEHERLYNFTLGHNLR